MSIEFADGLSVGSEKKRSRDDFEDFGPEQLGEWWGKGVDQELGFGCATFEIPVRNPRQFVSLEFRGKVRARYIQFGGIRCNTHIG